MRGPAEHSNHPPRLSLFERLSASVLTVASASIAGLWLLVDRLPRGNPLADSTFPMARSTAVVLLPLALGILVFVSSRSSRAGRRLALGLVAAAALAATVLGARGLETRMIPSEAALRQTADAAQVQGLAPVRMSPATAAGIVLLALAMAALAGESTPRRRRLALATGVAVALACGATAASYAISVPMGLASTPWPMSPWSAAALAQLAITVSIAAGLGADLERLLFGRPDFDVPLPPGEEKRRRFLAASLGFLSILVVLGGPTYLRMHVRRTRAEIGSTLQGMAALKVRHVEEWRRERLGDARALRHAPVLQAASATGDAWRRAVTSYLESFRAAYSYESIVLVDGDERLTAGPPLDDDPDTAALLGTARRTGDVAVGEIHRDRDGAVCLELAAPVLRLDGTPSGAAVWLHVHPATHLFPAIAAWPSPTGTGEILLAQRNGGRLVALSPRRGDAATAAPGAGWPSVTLRDEAGLSLLGGPRVVADYRGVATLAAARPVPGTPWLVVVKQDLDEAYAPLRDEVRRIVVGFALFLAVGALAAALLWRQRQQALVAEHTAAETARRAADERLALVMRHANDGILLLDESLRIIEANGRAAAMYGYDPEELLRLTIADLRAPETLPRMAGEVAQSASAEGVVFESVHRRRDGSTFPVEVSSRTVEVDGRLLRHSIIRDVSERKAQAAQLERMNRMYLALSRVNEALVRSGNAEELKADVCRIVVETAGFRLAWIGEPGEDGWVAASGAAGATEYLDGVRVCVDATRPEGRGPTGTAVREGRTQINNRLLASDAMAPWHERARQSGLRSSASFPLRVRDTVTGALTVYAEQEDFFRAAEVSLLEETASDLSFALDVLARDEERRAAEAARRESEERLRYLVSATPAIIYTCRADDYATTFVSENVTAILGHEPRQFVERPEFWVENLHPDDRENAFAAGASLTAGRSVIREYRFRHRDGTYRWMQDELRLVPATEERPAEIVGCWLDVTARKDAEAALHAREEIFSTIAAQSLDAVTLVDPATGRFVEFNETAHRSLGYTREEFAGMGIGDVQAEHSPEQVARNIRAIREHGQASFETRHRHKDGSLRDVHVRARQLALHDRAFMSAVWTDITESKRAERAARHRESLRRVESDVRRAVAVAARVEDAAPAALRALGEGLGFEVGYVHVLEADRQGFVSAGEWCDGSPEAARLAEACRRPAPLAQYSVARELANARGTIWTEDLAAEARRADGPWGEAVLATGFVRGAAVPLSSGGELLGILGVFSRRSTPPDPEVAAVLDGLAAPLGQFLARARAQAELQAERNALAERVAERTVELRGLNAALARANQMKDEFLASMSHELRTPLNAILGLSEALQESVYGPLQPRQSEALRTVEESGRHLLELINDILDLSKVEAGKLVLETADTPLGPACQAALRLVRGAAQQKHLALETAIVPEEIEAHVDPRRFKQIVVNLLSNAVKFTPEGGRVGLEVRRDGEAWVRVEVWDTGIGIPKEDLPRLFQPFTQLDSRLSRQHAGTGLGLALVRRLAGLHGGGVSLESEPGQGTRVSVRLPAHGATTSPSAPAADAEAARRTLRRILVVEDEPATAAQIARYLEESGHEVVTIDHGRPALPTAIEWRPDVILLDLLLPDVSGWEVLAALKADSRSRAIPVVISSVVEDHARAVGYGAFATLTKPIRRGDLAEVLGRVAVRRAEAPTEADERAPGEPPLVLLAEDNEANVRMVRDYLEARGYRVAVAGDGAAAAAMAAEMRPALVLMDVQMPRVDGLAATRLIRANPGTARTPVVALTALAMPGDKERCLEAGADAYLSKPVRLGELGALVDSLAGRAS